jgi:cytochrome c5
MNRSTTAMTLVASLLLAGSSLAIGSEAPITGRAAAAAASAAAGAAAIRTGREVYEFACQSCHSTGFAKAPQLGDSRAWRPLIREGVKHLSDEVVRGRGAMPPKGGRPELTRRDIEAAVAYMGRAAGAEWRQP